MASQRVLHAVENDLEPFSRCCLRRTLGGGPETDTKGQGTPANFHSLATAYKYNDPKNALATMGTFEKGGTVFTAATINWALGLSQQQGGWSVIDQITWNVFNRLG